MAECQLAGARCKGAETTIARLNLGNDSSLSGCVSCTVEGSKMAWTKRLTMVATGLAAMLLTSAAQAVTINFGVIPFGGTPSYTGATLASRRRSTSEAERTQSTR